MMKLIMYIGFRLGPDFNAFIWLINYKDFNVLKMLSQLVKAANWKASL